MAVQKARSAARVLLVTGAVFVAWLLAVWPPPIWWRTHRPRCTAMMRLRDDCSTGRRAAERTGGNKHSQPDSPTVRPPAALERMIIIAEDSRFKTHHGIDFIELREAWAAGGHRGASTITQQLAKNLYLSPSRSIFRKLKEAVTAVRLELVLPKERIMDLYLDVAEWGPGVWGVDAASQAYFGVPASRLSNAQAAALAATLPHPRSSNPTYRPARMLARRDLILARYYGGQTPVPRINEDPIPEVPVIEPPILPVIPLDSVSDSLIHQP
ncbi:MAG TPA: biosynthetic peptidoglycan transglycosylase [Gemmatimonadales bacterium]|nr:biosynthetic peptidoglycan transglycosylase [Gemmatimonadales bacterium]